jgi:putative IMPACT (imprinted ancient) family translation regulator
LGIPGLINAYKNATQEALDVAEIIERTQEDVYKIDFDYLQMNDVMRIIKEDNLEILKQDFDNRCSITFSVRKLHVNQVVHKMEGIENSKLIFCMPS